MRNRYEVTYVLMGTVHVDSTHGLFTKARKRARVLASEITSSGERVDVVRVLDTRNEGAEVWRETVSTAPLGLRDISCHKVHE